MPNDPVSEDAATAARATYRQLLVAWNERDARTFSTLFGADGVMIGYDGSSAEGAEAIVDHLEPIFTNHPTATYLAHVIDVREIGSGLVMVRAMAGMVPPGENQVNPSVNALHTVLLRTSDGEPSIVLFQNTPAQYHGRQDLSDEHLKTLETQHTAGEVLS
jgi:uncharacterized protein (TIGR02246 family)